MIGHAKPIASPEKKALAAANVDKQLKKFKNLTRAVINRTSLDTEQYRLFKPARLDKDNLVGVGIKGNHAGPAFNVKLTMPEQVNVAKQLHKLNHTVTAENLNGIISGENRFIVRELRL